MKVEQVFSDRKRFLDLLLLADEQEDMIDRYLERGDMFALYDEDKLRAVCVVTNEREGIYELKNIATCPDSQRKGYGKSLIEYLFHHYSDRCSVMFVGTGDTPHTLLFYQSCGFVPSHRIKNFFPLQINHIPEPDAVLINRMIIMVGEKILNTMGRNKSAGLIE